MNVQINSAMVRAAPTYNQMADEPVRREALLATLRCIRLRLQLAQAETDALGVSLRNGLIGCDEALLWLRGEIPHLLDVLEAE